MNQLKVSETKTGIVFAVKLHPRAGRDRIAGVDNDKLKIDVSAAPLRNKANQSMIKLLSKTLKVPQEAIVVKQGATGRNKLIEIHSNTSDEVKRSLQYLIFTK